MHETTVLSNCVLAAGVWTYAARAAAK